MAVPAGQNGNGQQARGPAAARPAAGMLHEIQALLVGFFTSLLPGDLLSALTHICGRH